MLSLLSFLITLVLFLFLPGFLLGQIFLRTTTTPLERFVLSIPLSFVVTTTLMLIMPYAGIDLTRVSLLTVFGALIVGLSFFSVWKNKKSEEITSEPLITRTRTWQIFILLLIATTFIQTSYYVNTIFPTATDLGHHMYWAQWIAEEGTVPIYEKTIVSPDDTTNPSASTASFRGTQKIPDFIIGEHLIFAAITLVSGLTIVSAFPSLVLFIALTATTLILFFLALRLFRSTPWGERAALWSYLLIGPLWTISGAGAKFVTGGVIGNVLGNLLTVTAIYFLYRALAERSRIFLVSVAALLITLVYTHHLSTFVFAYALMGMILCTILFAPQRIKLMRSWLSLLSPTLLLLLLGAGTFLLLVHIPSYINPEAISSSVGAPTKSTRTGLPLAQLAEMTGYARFLLAGLGLTAFSVLLLRIRRDATILYAQAIILGWFTMITAMVLTPEFLQVNILSTRIATYIVFPTALLAGAFAGWLLWHTRHVLPRWAYITLTSTLFLFVGIEGLQDNISAYKKSPKTQQAVATFHTARYVRDHLTTDTWALKDHNYITADTWMKVFMPRDYTNPLSRSYFARYESQPHREHCTREMITQPNSKMAESCYSALSVGPVIVNTAEDASSFADLPQFRRVYQNNDLSIFWHISHPPSNQ